MSGFVAVVNVDGAPIDALLLDRMTRFLTFRGPDRQCVRVTGEAGFGHTLLIVDDDARHEQQPFTADGRCWIVGDARVDGRDDLVAALGSREHGLTPDSARTTTDVELIWRAYRAWSDECVAHLLGDYAFAIWDAPRRRLFCARDHLGVKPLFYAELGRTVIVSNTLDCVRLHPAVSDDFDDQAIADFLLFGANQETDTTIFRDIRRLPPAHGIAWSPDEARRRRYWTLPVDEPVHFKRADDYADRFVELLRAAARDRLRTSRANVLMSGGLDSPTLAAVSRDIMRERSPDCGVQAITSVYDRLIPDADRGYAALVAAHLKIPIRYDVRDEEISIADWDRVSVHTPEPVANPPAFAAAVQFMRTMAADVRVFLYGEGPDNALRYEWRPYLSHLAARGRLDLIVRALSADLWMHPRVPLLSSLRAIAIRRRDEKRWHEDFPVWLDEAFSTRARCRERWEARHRAPAPGHPVRPRGYASFDPVRWQPLFDDCDITGAWGGADFRHPFLDLRLLRYMLSLPAMPWCRNKLVIRRSMRGALPRAVLRRRKQTIPVSADLQRARTLGFPRLRPAPELLQYVDPNRMPPAPRSEVELRARLRPLGLNHWLHHHRRIADMEESLDETASASYVR